MKGKVIEFLKELNELSNKHNLFIDGCGCCGSPSLHSIKDGKLDYEQQFDDLEYDEDKKQYFVYVKGEKVCEK